MALSERSLSSPSSFDSSRSTVAFKSSISSGSSGVTVQSSGRWGLAAIGKELAKGGFLAVVEDRPLAPADEDLGDRHLGPTCGERFRARLPAPVAGVEGLAPRAVRGEGQRLRRLVHRASEGRLATSLSKLVREGGVLRTPVGEQALEPFVVP